MTDEEKKKKIINFMETSHSILYFKISGIFKLALLFQLSFKIYQLSVYAAIFVQPNSEKTPYVVDRIADPNPTIPED